MDPFECTPGNDDSLKNLFSLENVRMVATILHCKLTVCKVSIRRVLCINIDVAKYSACISIATHVGV